MGVRDDIQAQKEWQRIFVNPIRAQALEEAARVAENFNAAGKPIAAAIRALKGTKE